MLLVPDFLEATAGEVLEVPSDFGDAFSVNTSGVLLGFGPVLTAATDGCLEGTEDVFAGLVLGLAEDPVAGIGLVIFFFEASLAVLSAAEGFSPSLPSSFLGEAGFFAEDPCLGTWLSAVALPLVSALVAAPLDAFSAPPGLTLLLSLTLGLFVGLLVFAESAF